MQDMMEGTWVIVPRIEDALLPKTRREYATYEVSSRLWKGWTTPGYRELGRRECDWFPNLHEAMAVLVQVRQKYPNACPVRIDRPRS